MFTQWAFHARGKCSSLCCGISPGERPKIIAIIQTQPGLSYAQSTLSLVNYCPKGGRAIEADDHSTQSRNRTPREIHRAAEYTSVGNRGRVFRGGSADGTP